VIGYDIDPDKNQIVADTLTDPLEYSNVWVIANPPYLAANKSKNKSLFNQYDTDDLYKIAIRTICDDRSGCMGGILIVPLNFLSSDHSSVKNYFFERYRIIQCKIFEEQVFEDTDYTICAFYFIRAQADPQIIPVNFFPHKHPMAFEISKKDDWLFGRSFYQWLEGIHTQGISRWTVDDYQKPTLYEEMSLATVAIGSMKNQQTVMCSSDIHQNILLQIVNDQHCKHLPHLRLLVLQAL
jgi:hypothetical protein